MCVPDVDGLRIPLWDSVCLLTCAVDAARPWKGMGPLEIADQTGSLGGDLALVETTAAGFGEGRGAVPQKDWIPPRLGPEGFCMLREDLGRSVLAACGTPPSFPLKDFVCFERT